MELSGIIQNGAVVTDGGFPLPEGTPVVVICPDAPAVEPPQGDYRVKLPLVKSDQPGSLHLSAEQVAEFLVEGDVPS